MFTGHLYFELVRDINHFFTFAQIEINVLRIEAPIYRVKETTHIHTHIRTFQYIHYIHHIHGYIYIIIYLR